MKIYIYTEYKKVKSVLLIGEGKMNIKKVESFLWMSCQSSDGSLFSFLHIKLVNQINFVSEISWD